MQYYYHCMVYYFFFFSSRRRHTRLQGDWSSDVCSSDLGQDGPYRDRVGHDLNYLGFAGVIGLTGTAGGPPVIPGVQIADIGRSEERRVGKEGRSWWSPDH